MIEMNEQQMQALETPAAAPLRIVNPRTKETFVLLRADEYARLTEEYDDESGLIPPDRSYPIWSPETSFSAAAALLQALEEERGQP